MEQFDERLRSMAKQETIDTPEGFDEHLQETLDHLPPRPKKRRGLGGVKGTLIAAAACVLLMGTALAASPGLRELLATALGGFVPYAQEQDGRAYEMDGLEVRVLSAMADQDTIRVYVQLKDLEGDRLSNNINAMGLVDVPAPPPSDDSGVTTSTFGSQCLSYDEENKTALIVCTTWGRVYENLSDAELVLFHVYDTQTLEDISADTTLHIPLDIEAMPAASLGEDTELAAGFFAETVRLSPLGLTAVTYGDTQYGYLVWSRIRLHMADGTEILSGREDGGPDGQGSYGKYGTDNSRRVLTWNFPQPLEVEQIQSVTIIDRDGGERTFPVELS